MTHFQMKFVENLRLWRKKRGLSQQKLSEMANVSPNYLNAIENGKNFPSPEVIQKISDILGLMPYQLFLEQHEEDAPVGAVISDIAVIKQRFVKDLSDLLQKYKEI